MSDRRGPWGLALLLLVLVPLALHGRLLRGEALLAGDVLARMSPWEAGGEVGPAYNLLPLDPLRTSYPTAALADELGPTRWNPRILLGEPVGSFLQPYWDYPPERALHGLAPGWLALGLNSLLNLILGGWVFLLYLGRGRRLPLRAALFGALAYQLSTYGCMWLGSAGILVTFAPWAAAAMWASERLGKDPRLRTAIPAGLCLGGALWAGFPPAVVPLCGVIGLGSLTHAPRGKRLRALGWVAAAGALGLAAGSMRLLPAALQFAAGTRIGGDAEPFRLGWTHALTALAPDILGHPLRGFNLLGGPGEPYANHLEVRLYTGFTVLLFTLLGLRTVPRRTLPWAMVAATAVLFASATPLGALWSYLPGLRSSTPTRLLASVHLIAPVLAAEGFAQRGRAGGALTRLAWGFALACLALGLFSGTRLGAELLVPASRPLSPGSIARLSELLPLWGDLTWAEGPGGRRNVLLSPTLGPLLLGLGCLVAVWVGRGGRRRRRAAAALWAALLVGDLLRESLVFLPATPVAQLFPETPGLLWAQEQAVGGRALLDRGWWANTAAPTGLYEVGGYTPVRSGRVDAMLRAGGAKLGRQTANPLHLRQPWRDALAVRVVLTSPGLEPTVRAGLRPLYVRADCSVWGNPTALPRVRPVLQEQLRWLPDRVAAEARVSAPDFDPRTEVVLEGVAPAAELVGLAEVTDVRDLASELRCHVRTDGPTALLVADAYAPGWTARFEGVPLEVLPAQGGLRAVVVPAGEGELVFSYTPRGWWLGWLISLLTVAGSCAVLRRGSARSEAG